ncbi:hypothetical protein SETIT_3G035300v2 [Setaria italica]|uniref:RNase H type-1 domain-containing protein n=1 Tax=Setaria italica TaxID=4555 RepID=A0A368QAY9_SETIT|nr:hypothetical protein SETIT_3G035300v2 [Setaria italica]
MSNIWDEAAIRRFFYPYDANEILKIKLPSTPSADWVAWNFEKTVMFLVRSAYKLAMREKYEMGATGCSSSAEGERDLWKRVWSAGVPSKNKKYRHLDQECSFELCGHQMEDVFHAIITCPHACALRNELRKQVVLPVEEDIRNMGLNGYLPYWIGSYAHPVLKKPAADGRWVPPSGKTLKINIDGAFIKETGGAAVGVIIRNNSGKPVLASWHFLRYCRDAEEAEAEACRTLARPRGDLGV